MKPICISIGGLDPTAGAGILLDIKVFTELEVQGFAVASVITAQNTDQVYASNPVALELFTQQLGVILANYQVHALKIGLIGSEHISAILEMEEFYEIPIRVLDPILYSTSGYKFIAPNDLIPLAKVSTLVMPNYSEALSLLNLTKDTQLEQQELARELRTFLACESLLLKGGHLNSATDIFVDRDSNVKSIDGTLSRSSNEVHGTGCLLSSAITAELSKGIAINESIVQAKSYLSRKLDKSEKVAGDEKFSFSF